MSLSQMPSSFLTCIFRHALGNRARKAGQGVLTVRFEMPYAIWCTNCPKETIIGQGVRFNAEKKKVGNYYSSPIYSFRMKHTPCGGWIEIKTDPKNTAYVVTEGARKRDTGNDKILEGDFEISTEEERERLRNDAFAALEVTIDDRKLATADQARIEGLMDDKERHWDDPYTANQRLRRTFRVERKMRERKAAATESLKDKMSLGIDLLEESAGDERRAAAVDFGQLAEDNEKVVMRTQARGLLEDFKGAPQRPKPQPSTRKPSAKPSNSKSKLQKELSTNTRAVADPFLSSRPLQAAPLLGIKRKRIPTEKETGQVTAPSTNLPLLVDYDSD